MRITRTAGLVFACCFPLVAQDETLTQCVVRFERAASEQEKIDALHAIEALAQAGNGEDLAAVTRALARGFTEESRLVRVHALVLVSRSQDRDTAVEEVVKGCREFGRRWRRTAAGLERRTGPTARRRQKDLVVDMPSLKFSAEELAKATRLVEERGSESIVLAVAELALRRFGDDPRTIPGWGELLDYSHDEHLAERLFDFGCGAALREAIRPLEAMEERVRETRAKVLEAERVRPRPKPGYFQGSRDAWIERERNNIAHRVKGAQVWLTQAQDFARTYADALRRFAAARELPEPPADESFAAWRAWAATTGRALDK